LEREKSSSERVGRRRRVIRLCVLGNRTSEDPSVRPLHLKQLLAVVVILKK